MRTDRDCRYAQLLVGEDSRGYLLFYVQLAGEARQKIARAAHRSTNCWGGLRLFPASKRLVPLVLLVTDGEPADIDERDPQYLRHDAKKAVNDLRAMDIHSHCLTLDPDADRYVARIFGENHYSIVDDVQRLPERLPNVFAALTR